jgi:signal transduction histidine kinase
MTAINLARWCRSPVRQSMLQWAGVDLMYKLAAAASVLLLCATGFVAALVSSSIGKAIVDRYGAEAALFTDSFVAPRIQELAERSTLREDKKVELDGLFTPTVVGRPILAFRIWKDDQVIYSNNREMIGRRFPLSPARARAWEGGVSTELNQLDGDDEVQIRALGVHILEVYAPLRQAGTARIIALAETYEIGSDLYYEVRAAQALVWLVFFGSAAGLISLLFILAGRGASEVCRVNQEKNAFRLRMGSANRRISEMDELHMRRVGTELFSGPVQLIGVALLKLDSLRALSSKVVPTQPQNDDVEAIRSALNEALADIRNLSESLVPSKLYELSLAETISTAVRRHERQTGASVTRELASLPAHVPFSLKASLYRFVREALDKGTGSHCVRAGCADDLLFVEVRHTGDTPLPWPYDDQQWVRTFQDRVESIGGELLINARPNAVSYTAQFKIEELEVRLG